VSLLLNYTIQSPQGERWCLLSSKPGTDEFITWTEQQHGLSQQSVTALMLRMMFTHPKPPPIGGTVGVDWEGWNFWITAWPKN
jgi:hypothetical protein